MKKFRCETCGKLRLARGVFSSDSRNAGYEARWNARGHCPACRSRLVRVWWCGHCGATAQQARGRPRKFCQSCLVGGAKLLVFFTFACEACDLRGQARPSRVCPACGRLLAHSDPRSPGATEGREW